jgi:hypothetical protein
MQDRIPGGIAALVTLLPVCSAEAGTPQAFTEEAVARGVDYLTPPGEGAGRGLAFVDLDQDGDADLVLTGRFDGHIGLYENTGDGSFVDRSTSSGLAPLAAPSGVIAADYDQDRDLDLYFSNYGSANVLLQNQGNFLFEDVSVQARVADTGRGTGCAFADYDGDGRLDLYVGNLTDVDGIPNRLFRGLPTGKFNEIGFAAGVDDASLTWQSVFADFDLDGDPDLYNSNDKGFGCFWTNHLYENVGGAFTDRTSSSGTAGCIFSMGVGLGDFDANGFPDLYCSNMPNGNLLFLNQGDGTFIESAETLGVASYAIGWGALFFDYDNDGHQDLYVCNQNAPNRLYHRDGTGPAVDLALSYAVNVAGPSFCVATADIDLDGDLDLAVQTAGEKVRLFMNHEGETRRWMKMRVRGVGGNYFGIGASVTVTTSSLDQVQQVYAGSNYKSQNDLALNFGLEDATSSSSAEVLFSDGSSRLLGPMACARTWTLYHSNRLGDGNEDGVVNFDDFPLLLDAFTGPGPGLLQPGQEMFDFDGDIDVDIADCDAFLLRYVDPLEDCDENGIADLREIAMGTADDLNNNGIPDRCEPTATDFQKKLR